MHTQDSSLTRVSSVERIHSYFITGNRLPYPDLRSIRQLASKLAKLICLLRRTRVPQSGAFACIVEPDSEHTFVVAGLRGPCNTTCQPAKHMHSSARALNGGCCLQTAARAFHCSRAWACAGAADLEPSADGLYHFCIVGSGPAGFYTAAQVGSLHTYTDFLVNYMLLILDRCCEGQLVALTRQELANLHSNRLVLRDSEEQRAACGTLSS